MVFAISRTFLKQQDLNERLGLQKVFVLKYNLYAIVATVYIAVAFFNERI
jgi:hypothetical protein